MKNVVRENNMQNQLKTLVKELLAEFIGVYLLMLIGCSSTASMGLNINNKDDFRADTFAIAFSWGIAVFIGIAISIAISGGHLNPAVSIAFASMSRFPWTKVGPYILAQLLGSFLGSGTAYLVYRDAINAQHDLLPLKNQTELRAFGHPLSTGGFFTTFPAAHITIEGTIIDQIIATCSLLICVMVVIDANNLNVPRMLQPFLLAFVIETHVIAFGYNCGAPLNPARDFGPRLFTAMAGWGCAVFKPLNGIYWWAGGIISPIVGAVLGVWIYYIFIEYLNQKKLGSADSREVIALK